MLFLADIPLTNFFRPSDIMALFMCVLRTNLLPSQACSKMVFIHSIKNQALQKNLDQLKIKQAAIAPHCVWSCCITLV